MKSITLFAIFVAVLLGSVQVQAQDDLIGKLFGTRSASTAAQRSAVTAQLNPAPAPMQPFMLMAGCPGLTADDGCGTLVNNLGRGRAITQLVVDGVRVMINGENGRWPSRYLVHGQSTRFPWGVCRERDTRTGDCWYTISGVTVGTTNIRDRFPLADVRMFPLGLAPVVSTPDKQCFRKRILVSDQMRDNGFTPAISPEDKRNADGSRVECPADIAPEGSVVRKK